MTVEPALESRVLLTTTMGYGMYPMTYSPDEWLENVQGSVQVEVRYDYFGTGPVLVFNSLGTDETDPLNDHDSTVPFIISGSTTGPATLEITDSHNMVKSLPLPGGPFSFQQFESTRNIPPGFEVAVKVRVLTKGGKEATKASASDTVVSEDVRMADELFKLRPLALHQARTQAMHQSDRMIDNYFTDEKIFEIALEIVSKNPNGPGLQQTIDDLKNVRIAAIKATAGSFLGQAAENAMDFTLKGDLQIYRFKATSMNPAFPGFAAGVAEIRNGIDILHPNVSLGWGSLPDLDDLDRIASLNSTDDIKTLFGSIRPVVSVGAPIKFDGVTFGSIGASASGVTIGDLMKHGTDGTTRIPNLTVGSSLQYSRKVEQDLFGVGRLRGVFNFNIGGHVQMQPNESGETYRLFDHRTKDTGITIRSTFQY